MLVIGWIALALFTVAAGYALDRHYHWLRIARAAAQHAAVAEKLRKRPTYDRGHAMGHVQEELAAEVAEDIPARFRAWYLRQAAEELTAERDEAADMQDEMDVRVKRRRRLARARKGTR